MEPASFLPKISNRSDRVNFVLMFASRAFLLAAVLVTPILFLPGVANLLSSVKIFGAVFLVLISVVLYSLAILRSGFVNLRFVPILVAFWAVALVSAVSASLSATPRISLFGDVIEIHTVAFLILLAAIMSLMLVVDMTKRSVIIFYATLFLSTVGLMFFHLMRILFGPQFLSLGQFNSLSATPVGSLNDFGLLMAMMVLFLLVALVQLKLSLRIQVVIGVCIALALGLLAVVNFFSVWVVLSLFSLLVLMYCLTRDRFGIDPSNISTSHQEPMGVTIAIVALVFVVGTIFLIGGSSIGNSIASTTGVSYLEVRPSVSATVDVMRQVYRDHLLIGSGPNRFAENWQQYKDPSITETIFWNTNFSAGNGYISTWFVTTGVLGLLAWLSFLLFYLYTGIKMLLVGKAKDEFWYFAGTVSFVVGVFIWGMAVVYVPGPAILIIGAAVTGCLLIASQKLVADRQYSYNLLTSAKTGFVLITIVMLTVIGMIGIGYKAAEQLSAAYLFSTISDPETATARLEQAFNLYPSPTFAREIALYNLQQLNNLMTLTDITSAQQQLFQQTITAGISAGRAAVALNETDARNYAVLGDLYAVLSVINIEGAKERADTAYVAAEKLDPTNPYYVLQKAALAYRAGDKERARSLTLQSLDLKSNYTDALLLLSQIDIAVGDVDRAIETTKSLISLESNNPGRYYQLGVLYSSVQNRPAAIEAFSTAVMIDPSYANARYLRALEYAKEGDTKLAAAELKIVRDLNPDNAVVNGLIKELEQGQTITSASTTQAITEPNSVSVDNEVTTTDTVPTTDVISPVNRGRSTEKTSTPTE